jgi:DNA polymerase-3 subunit delta
MGAGGRHPLQVMATLHGHVGAMLRLDGLGRLSDAEAGRLLGMHPFRAGKLVGQAARLGSGGVARAVELLAQADLDLRGLKAWPPELVLEVVVARLSRLAGRSRPATRPRTGAR